MNGKRMKRAGLLLALVSIGNTAWAGEQAGPKVAQKAESKGFSAGFDISDSANARQIGLPIYPGSKASRDSENESAAANLSIWAGGFGAKLVVMKLETPDSPQKVASYYQDALGKYSTVLDCSKADSTREIRKKNADDNTLSCDNDTSVKNSSCTRPAPGACNISSALNRTVRAPAFSCFIWRRRLRIDSAMPGLVASQVPMSRQENHGGNCKKIHGQSGYLDVSHPNSAVEESFCHNTTTANVRIPALHPCLLSTRRNGVVVAAGAQQTTQQSWSTAAIRGCLHIVLSACKRR